MGHWKNPDARSSCAVVFTNTRTVIPLAASLAARNSIRLVTSAFKLSNRLHRLSLSTRRRRGRSGVVHVSSTRVARSSADGVQHTLTEVAFSTSTSTPRSSVQQGVGIGESFLTPLLPTSAFSPPSLPPLPPYLPPCALLPPLSSPPPTRSLPPSSRSPLPP